MKLQLVAFPILLFMVALIGAHGVQAQTYEQYIVGKWQFNKIDFGKESIDTAEIIEGWKDVTIHFESNKKFTTYKKMNGKRIEVGNGSYSIEAGKYFIQDGLKNEIKRLTDKEFVIEVGDLGVTLYLVKSSNPSSAIGEHK